MHPFVRKAVLMLIDSFLISLALLAAILIRFEGDFPSTILHPFLYYSVPFSAVFVGVFYFCGLYQRAWRYASIGELSAMLLSVLVGAALNFACSYLWESGHFPLPRSIYFLHAILAMTFIGASRLFWRVLCEKMQQKNEPLGLVRRRILIVGAGDAGMMVARELKNHYPGSVQIVGFVDKDPAKFGMVFNGLQVLGNRNDIPRLVAEYDIREIVIAIPSAERKDIRDIVAICQKTRAQVKIVPGIFDLIDGKVKISNIREVQVEDLLGREAVRIDLDKITGYLHGEVVMVTGAGGSIGSELCRQLGRYQPGTLLLLDNCENNMYDIELELGQLFPRLQLVSLVKDVRDRRSLQPIFQTYKPKIVFHAAAHKHVPLMEKNPEEALKNNVMGTFHVAEAASRCGAKKFVLISTDKAVNPTSFMGASKRLAEIVVQFMNRTSRTQFVAVRFGNVLGSRGSVVPLFKKQIAAGGPVTVTDAEMIRYFMTIPEAVQLVTQAGIMAEGGETYVLDMGDPVRIIDLARNIIRLSGFEPGKDIEIKVTGIRPGEKLFEELLTAEEGTTATSQERIFVAKPQPLDMAEVEAKIIRRISEGNMPQDHQAALAMIRDFLPEFRQRSLDCDREEEAI